MFHYLHSILIHQTVISITQQPLIITTIHLELRTPDKPTTTVITHWLARSEVNKVIKLINLKLELYIIIKRKNIQKVSLYQSETSFATWRALLDLKSWAWTNKELHHPHHQLLISNKKTPCNTNTISSYHRSSANKKQLPASSSNSQNPPSTRNHLIPTSSKTATLARIGTSSLSHNH